CGGGSTEPVVPEGSGRLELPLIAQGPDGGPYQLVNATFIITGPQNLTITHTSSDEVTVPLIAGVYSIRLDGNWHLDRSEERGQPIPAELFSPNPMTFAGESDYCPTRRFSDLVSGLIVPRKAAWSI